MRLVPVRVENLRPGMFIAELDRPWLETPFLLQGFVVQSEQDIAYVSRYVETVYVDLEYKGTAVALTHFESLADAELPPGLNIKSQFNQAKANFESTVDAIENAFAQIKEGSQSLDVKKIQKSIRPLIESVFKSKEASAAMARLRVTGKYLYNHSVAMAVWAALIGREMGLMNDQLTSLVTGCALCDIGMSLLPSNVYEQRGKLSNEQIALIQRHPERGSAYVKENIGIEPDILGIIEFHHERFDGSGYPKGLSGNEIPLFARIAGLVDTYDSMINSRPYARLRTSYEATQELLDCGDSLFQKELVDLFIKVVGIFPVGALVELSNGSVGIVARQHKTRKLRPEVVIVLDELKRKKKQLGFIDLAEQSNDPENSIWIRAELPVGTYGLNPKDFFF